MNPFLLCLFLALAILTTSNSQSINNIGLGLPNVWNGDKYGVLDCPATNIPTFLDGYFLCQLSASYGNASNPDGQKLTHMIDAIGAVGSFHIQNGTVTFSAQYYPSINYKIWDFYERDMAKSTVAWDVSFGYRNNTAINLWSYVPPDPNMGPASPNVDFWKIGKNIVGGTENDWLGYEFDVPTLSNFKSFPFVDVVDGNLPAITPMDVGIHEHKDPDGTIWAGFNAYSSVGNVMHLYQGLYTVDTQGVRKVAGLYDYGQFDFKYCGKNGQYNGDPKLLPGYIHSITATNNYIIIPVTSLLTNPCMTTVKSNDTITRGTFAYSQFFDNVPLRFLIFNKKYKYWVTKTPLEAPSAMFVTHQLNAYEINEYNIVADMISYPNADVYSKYLYRDFLTTQLYPNAASITRFNLLLQQNKTVTSVLTPQPTLSVEFPQMNNAYRTRYYAWSYVVENPYSAGNSILKINVNDASGKQNLEYKAGSTVALNEPVFIAKPNSSAEDDGVLIIRGLDVGSEKALLVVVDAKTMTEIGRANVPILIPFGFHNKFFATDSL